MGDGSRLENGRASRPWGFDSLSFRFVIVPLAERQRHQPSKLNRWVQLPQGTLSIRGSANGRLPGFEPGGEGSTPSPRAAELMIDPGQLLPVVTPGSEPGGRWFDSNPRS